MENTVNKCLHANGWWKEKVRSMPRTIPLRTVHRKEKPRHPLEHETILRTPKRKQITTINFILFSTFLLIILLLLQHDFVWPLVCTDTCYFSLKKYLDACEI